MRPTFIALADEGGEVFGVVKRTVETIPAPKVKPTRIEIIGKLFFQFRYCKNCKRPVFVMTNEFCRSECREVYKKEKRPVKNLAQRIIDNVYTHLLVAGLVFVCIYGFFARLK